MFAAARLILRHPDGAEDAVREALVRAWRDLPGLRDPSRLDAWLHRLLVRACSDEGRRRRCWRLEQTVVAVELGRNDGRLDALADADEMERAFRRLSEAHREVLVLQHVADLSTPDIAAVLGIPAGTVKSRAHFALEALRSALAAEARLTPVLDRLERGA